MRERGTCKTNMNKPGGWRGVKNGKFGANVLFEWPLSNIAIIWTYNYTVFSLNILHKFSWKGLTFGNLQVNFHWGIFHCQTLFHYQVLCSKCFWQLLFLALVSNLVSFSSQSLIFPHNLLFAVRKWLLGSLDGFF